MDSVSAYLGLLALVGAERLAELAVSRRNAAWSFANGGVEHGRGHYPAMVALHAGLLAGCAVEVVVLGRAAPPVVGLPLVGVVLVCQVVRWWCVGTLGRRWNTRVIVVPGMPRVTRGPYRWLAHPNYVVVAIEGLALPLAHGAWLTAVAFTVADALLLRTRLAVEEGALAALAREVE